MSEINAEVAPEGRARMFDADERLLFTGKELETILHEVVGTASVVFMKGTDIVMPATELHEAVGDFVEKSPETWKKAIDLAPSKGPNLGFELNPERRGSSTIILMTERHFFNQQIVNDTDVVIDKDGYVIKNRHGHAGWVGRMSAGPRLLEEATPVFPDGWNPMLPPTDPRPALGTGKPEDGFALDDPLTPVQRFALLLVALALGLSIASFVIAVTGH